MFPAGFRNWWCLLFSFPRCLNPLLQVDPRNSIRRLTRSIGFFEGNSVRACGALCKSIDCHWALRRVYPASCTTFFPKKKEKTHWLIEKSKNRQPWIDRFLQEHATGELERVAKDERASLFSAQQSVYVWTRPGPWSGCPVSYPDPNNTIGLLCVSMMYIRSPPANGWVFLTKAKIKEWSEKLQVIGLYLMTHCMVWCCTPRLPRRIVQESDSSVLHFRLRFYNTGPGAAYRFRHTKRSRTSMLTKPSNRHLLQRELVKLIRLSDDHEHLKKTDATAQKTRRAFTWLGFGWLRNEQ